MHRYDDTACGQAGGLKIKGAGRSGNAVCGPRAAPFARSVSKSNPTTGCANPRDLHKAIQTLVSEPFPTFGAHNQEYPSRHGKSPPVAARAPTGPDARASRSGGGGDAS